MMRTYFSKNYSRFFWCLLLGSSVISFRCITCTSIGNEELRNGDNCSTVCFSKECIELSNDILESMNSRMQPCEDFYQFACGNYIEKFKDESRFRFMDYKSDLFGTVKDILEEYTASPGSATEKVKIIYESCINRESSDSKVVQALQEFFIEVGLSNWPFIDSNFAFVNITFHEVLGRAVSYAQRIFIMVYNRDIIPADEWAENFLNFTMYPPSQEKDLENEKVILANVLRYLGLNEEEILRAVEEALSVEKRINELRKNNSQWYKNYSSSDEAEDERLYDCTHPNKNELCDVLKSIISNANVSSRYTSERFFAQIYHAYYVENIFSLLRTYSDRALAHYIALRIIVNNMQYLNLPVRRNLQYAKTSHFEDDEGIMEEVKWKMCLSWIMENLKDPLGHMYVSRMWSKEAVKELDDIFEQLKTAIVETINSQEWIEEEDKEKLAEGVQTQINTFPIYIEYYNNVTSIDNLYRKFQPTNENFVRNIFNYKKYIFNLSVISPIAYSPGLFPFNVAAMGATEVDLSFGILLPTTYRYSYPKIFNLAKIGFIIGHEIGHFVYYYLARETKEDGKTREHFIQRKNCLIEQYFNFEIKNIQRKVPANRTVSEDFPDNLSLRITEKISQEFLEKMNKNKFSLPGLNYSPEELMYIFLAQAWCEASNNEKEWNRHGSRPHCPPEFRMKGILMNSEKFSQVYKCPPGSFMNPEKKCSIFN